MKKTSMFFMALAVTLSINAQTKVFTKTGKILFTSKAPEETIEAVNSKVLSVIDFVNNKMEFSVLIMGFEFTNKNKLMQQHFNTRYMESTKFPKATFVGTFKTPITLAPGETKNVEIEGVLKIKNAEKKITTTATFTNNEGKINADCNLQINLEEYNVKVSPLHKNKINNVVQLAIKLSNMEEMK